MDSDSWISRLAAAKRHYLNQRQQSSQSGLWYFLSFLFRSIISSPHLHMFDRGIFLIIWFSDRLDFDEYKVEEEPRPDFPCPYCYEDHDIISLCSHLEDEHPFESKVVVSIDFSNLIEIILLTSLNG
ncbi:Protein DEHYDRATION-INDUCED 19 like 4 [Dendrobium catenatum]|uniref:Protein DEHYDRATION-INDUCED 19 like 4 n=1 Tax=Dendrobium catenatum TaxID=906689 RepID=A0A2I0WM23_9ASPA|nr:Protein DEHYDRATION-INDUCED 19 like 4 [Dendrobium catenatum]